MMFRSKAALCGTMLSEKLVDDIAAKQKKPHKSKPIHVRPVRENSGIRPMAKCFKETLKDGSME